MSLKNHTLDKISEIVGEKVTLRSASTSRKYYVLEKATGGYASRIGTFTLYPWPQCCATRLVSGITIKATYDRDKLFPLLIDLIAITLRNGNYALGLYTNIPGRYAMQHIKKAGFEPIHQYINHRYNSDRKLDLIAIHAYEHVDALREQMKAEA